MESLSNINQINHYDLWENIQENITDEKIQDLTLFYFHDKATMPSNNTLKLLDYSNVKQLDEQLHGFHGSANPRLDIILQNEFLKKYISGYAEPELGKGIYFTSNAETAKSYGENSVNKYLCQNCQGALTLCSKCNQIGSGILNVKIEKDSYYASLPSYTTIKQNITGLTYQEYLEATNVLGHFVDLFEGKNENENIEAEYKIHGNSYQKISIAKDEGQENNLNYQLLQLSENQHFENKNDRLQKAENFHEKYLQECRISDAKNFLAISEKKYFPDITSDEEMLEKIFLHVDSQCGNLFYKSFENIIQRVYKNNKDYLQSCLQRKITAILKKNKKTENTVICRQDEKNYKPHFEKIKEILSCLKDQFNLDSGIDTIEYSNYITRFPEDFLYFLISFLKALGPNKKLLISLGIYKDLNDICFGNSLSKV